MEPVVSVITTVFVSTLVWVSVGGLVSLRVSCSPLMRRRFSSSPLAENEWVKAPPLSRWRAANEWGPSTVSVALVTMISWPSKLVLSKLMSVSLVKSTASAGSARAASRVIGRTERSKRQGFFIGRLS